MRAFLAALTIVLVAGLVAVAAPPPQTAIPPQSPTRAEFDAALARIDKLEAAAKPDRATATKAADPAKGWDCGCITFKQRCSCGAVCTCAGSYGAAADAKKAAPNPHPCISHNGYWWTWDGYDWKLGERDTTAQAATYGGTTCSNGVCYPAAGSYGGGCAGGSCGGAGYSSVPVFGGGVFSGFGGGGSCAGGSCGGGGRRR